MRLLVFSDNHGDVEVMDRIIANEPHDMTIHAGDFTVSRTIIKSRFDHWVDGNNDWPPEKEEESFQIGEFTFNLQHGHNLPVYNHNAPKKMAKIMKRKGIDVLIFGHTHVPFNEEVDGVFLFNPGSCRLPRSDSGKTYGIIHINNGKIHGEIKKVIG